MEFTKLDEFQKDLKKLKKRFRTLEDDLKVLEKVLRIEPGPDGNGRFSIEGLGIEQEIVKVKKFACKALKNKGAGSGIRIIYAYIEETDTIEYIEIYYKGDKEIEDRDRILDYYE